jgi:tripartite-type tricarboxylate transporter receptor subunit TctC
LSNQVLFQIRRGDNVKFSRRRFLNFAATTAGLPVLPRNVMALDYPTRSVRIVVGFAAGGASDIIARLMAHSLSERLGQQFVVENRPGATGNIATEEVVKAAPDGYTLLLVAPPNAINASLYPSPNFVFLRDIAPVANMTREPSVVVVHPMFPAETIPKFISYAKARPGEVTMASAGKGSASHLSGELFKMMADVKLVDVPYRGGAPALADLMSGQVQVMFSNITSSIGHIRAGKLRPLAVTTAMRSNALPEIPPVGDFLPGYEASSVYGVGAPKDTPMDVIYQLNREINASLADPKLKTQITDMGSSISTGSPFDFGESLAAETKKWAEVINFFGIKAE